MSYALCVCLVLITTVAVLVWCVWRVTEGEEREIVCVIAYIGVHGCMFVCVCVCVCVFV